MAKNVDKMLHEHSELNKKIRKLNQNFQKNHYQHIKKTCLQPSFTQCNPIVLFLEFVLKKLNQHLKLGEIIPV